MTTPADLDPWRAPDAVDPADALWRDFAVGEPAGGRDVVVRWLRRGREAAAVPAAVVVALLLLAAPVGLVWARLSPRVGVMFEAQGPSLEQPEGSEFFSADGTFLLALVLAGLLSGAAVWRLTRGRGPGVAVGLALGGLVGGAVAREVGGRLVVDERLAALCAGSCTLYDGTQEVRSGLVELGDRGLYLGGFAWAVAALVVLVVLTAAFDRDPDPSAS